MPIGSRKPKKNSSIDKARRQSAINALAGVCESAYHVGEVDDFGAENLANFFAPGLMASHHGCPRQALC